MPEEMSFYIKPEANGLRVSYSDGKEFFAADDGVAAYISGRIEESKPSNVSIDAGWPYSGEELKALRQLVHERTGIPVR